MTEPIKLHPPHPIYRIYSLLRVGPRAIFLRLYDHMMRLITGAPVWSLSKIRPFLYVGGQHRTRGWGKMSDEGITAVLNMRELRHDRMKRLLEEDAHLHLDTIDNTPISIENLHRAADFIKIVADNQGKVYVHCGVGVGRAPSAVAGYLIKYENMTAEDALDAIREVRPFIHPTSSQRQQLHVFENLLREN